MDTTNSIVTSSNYTYENNDLHDVYLSPENTSLNHEQVDLVRQPVHMIAIFSIAYGLVFIFAVTGNFLVIAVIFKTPAMRNVTNYFILNLAVADILVAIFVLPMTLLANIFSGKFIFYIAYRHDVTAYLTIRK